MVGMVPGNLSLNMNLIPTDPCSPRLTIRVKYCLDAIARTSYLTGNRPIRRRLISFTGGVGVPSTFALEAEFSLSWVGYLSWDMATRALALLG